MENCTHNNNKQIQSVMLITKPPKSKSNPNGLTGENMRIFFKQKLTHKVFKRAVETGHIIVI